MSCAKCSNTAGGAETMECVLAALDTIKQHFLMLQGESVERAKLIGSLQTRNDKLNVAIELLQQRTAADAHLDKRRKCGSRSPKKLAKRGGSVSADSSMQCDDISPLPQTQNSLNMNIALNSEQLFDEAQDEDESIAETERTLASPCRKLCSARRKPKPKPDCENVQPQPPNKPLAESWLQKTPLGQRPSSKPRISLSLKSNPNKLKQTRLQFDGSRAQKEVQEKDIIEASPNLYTSLKQAKQSRTLMLRTGNNSVLDASSGASGTKGAMSNNQPHFDSDDDELFFDFNSPGKEPAPPLLPPSLPPCSGITDSVILLTPGTQDIVFVDDSSDDSQHLNTDDLMAELMKPDNDASFSRLKKFEAKTINKAKGPRQPVQLPIIKNEVLTEPAEDVGNESTKLPEDIEKDNVEEDEQRLDEEAEEFPRPFVVKLEQASSLKERYNINCEDCEKYIAHMGSNLTEEKIKKYLENCQHGYERARQAHNTPDGYWNPLMESFAADDPRNEVLIAPKRLQ